MKNKSNPFILIIAFVMISFSSALAQDAKPNEGKEKIEKVKREGEKKKKEIDGKKNKAEGKKHSRQPIPYF